jgi:vacuolar-type H+-ATPase subunit E/Vma4
MGFEELTSELQKSADAEGKKIVRASERTAEKTIDDANEKARSLVDDARKEASALSKQETSERITSAKLAAKKMVDEARDEAVEKALESVWREFKANSLKKSAYPALFARLLKEAADELGDPRPTAYVRDEDKSLLSGSNYKSMRLSEEYCGGVILESSDGKVRVNRTLEEVFSQKKNELRKEIYQKLF